LVRSADPDRQERRAPLCVVRPPTGRRETKRGEAHPMNDATMLQPISRTYDTAMIAAVCASPAWHALWTRSHCEQLVHDQLVAKGFGLFLPMIDRCSRRGGLRHLMRCPMVPGCLFLTCCAGYGSQ